MVRFIRSLERGNKKDKNESFDKSDKKKEGDKPIFFSHFVKSGYNHQKSYMKFKTKTKFELTLFEAETTLLK